MSGVMPSWTLSSHSMGTGAHVYLSYRSLLAETDTCGATFVLTTQGLHSRVVCNGMKQNRLHPCYQGNLSGRAMGGNGWKPEHFAPSPLISLSCGCLCWALA